MESAENYHWLWSHTVELLRQYTLRYGKIHSMHDLVCNILLDTPNNINLYRKMTPFAQAMPEKYFRDDAVDAYRCYYMGEKRRFAKWKASPQPRWWVEA